MSIGENIRRFRKEMKDENGRTITQEKLAEKLGVSFQAVSSWERDEYLPETENLLNLAKVFDVSVADIVEDKKAAFETKETIYDWEHMKTYVKTTARNLGLYDTLKAVDFAVEAHTGQTRKNSDIPYIYHPLSMACHALSVFGSGKMVFRASCRGRIFPVRCRKTVSFSVRRPTGAVASEEVPSSRV